MEAQKPIVRDKISGEIVETDVSAEDYMKYYAAHHYEWVRGTVIKMSPINDVHYFISRYLAGVLQVYFELKPIGSIREDPFVMRLPDIESRRLPDIQVILDANPHELKPTYMDGPADICIEVVSPGSVSVDRGDKFEEYEKGGVGEYWIIDPLHDEALFYRLNDEGVYISHPTKEGIYRTPVLPDLKIHVPTLWQKQLPNYFEIGQAVQAMLESNK